MFHYINFIGKLSLLSKYITLVQSPAFILVAINLIAFIAIRLAAIYTDASTFVDLLAISTSDGIMQHPWTPLSYMFVHVDLTHLLFNMAVLSVSCGIIDRLSTSNNFIIYITYIAGAVAGALIFRLCATGEAVFIGASCGVMAIVGLLGVFSVKQKIPFSVFGKINVTYIIIVLSVFHLAIIIPGNQAVGVAHAAGMFTGAVTGVIFLLQGTHRHHKKTDINIEIEKINIKARNSGYASLTAEERRTIENNIKI